MEEFPCNRFEYDLESLANRTNLELTVFIRADVRE